MFPNHNIDFSSRFTKKHILMKLIKEMIRYVPCHGTTNTREIKQEDRRTIAFLRKRRWLKRNRCWITSLMSVWGSIKGKNTQKLRRRVGKMFSRYQSSLQPKNFNEFFLPTLDGLIKSRGLWWLDHFTTVSDVVSHCRDFSRLTTLS